jgi:hypothetical protein
MSTAVNSLYQALPGLLGAIFAALRPVWLAPPPESDTVPAEQRPVTAVISQC